MSYKTFAELRDEAARVATPRYIEIFNWALEHNPFSNHWEAFEEAFCDLYDYEAMSEDEAREWAADNAYAVEYFLEERRDRWASHEPLSEYDVIVLSRLHDELRDISDSDKGEEQYEACFLHHIYCELSEEFPDLDIHHSLIDRAKLEVREHLADGYHIVETLDWVKYVLRNRIYEDMYEQDN